MLNVFKNTRAWQFPTAFGLIAGVIIAGVGFRLSAQPRNAGVAIGSPTDGLGVVSTAPGTPGSTRVAAASPASGPAGTQPVQATQGSAVAPVGSASPGNGGRSGIGPGVTAAPVPLTASDIGVTATSINVGVAILSAGQFGNLIGGNADPTLVKSIWNTYFDAINKSGGILGRKIVPFYQVVDITDSNSQQAACNTWAQSDKVFMVFGGDAISQTGQLCLALQNHTLLSLGASSSAPFEYYRQSGFRIISQAANSTRGVVDWALALQHLGKLKGKTLGLMYINGDTATEQGFIPTLKRLGYKLAYTSVLSSDMTQQGSQAVAAATQMQAHGVDLVLSSQLGFLGLQAFVQAAEQQNYTPSYSAVGGGIDSAYFLKSMPKSFQGAITVTSQLFSSPPHQVDPVTTACRNQFRRLGGPSSGEQSANMQFLLAACGGSHLLSAVGGAVGPNLTRNSFANGVQSLGSSFNWYASLGGSFAPGRTDYNTHVRAMVFGAYNATSTNCTGTSSGNCWNDLGPAFNPEVS